MRALRVSHVGHPDLAFPTPSGKVELYSARAIGLGLPPLPVHEPLPASRYPLTFRQGRTLAHFHGFYDHGRALPSLAALEPEPVLWISPADALRHLPRVDVSAGQAGEIAHGGPILAPQGLSAQELVSVCEGGELNAIAEIAAGMLRPRKVFR